MADKSALEDTSNNSEVSLTSSEVSEESAKKAEELKAIANDYFKGMAYLA